uniref:Uncharacterized protein n=1 Tax=Lactuca sativa TaxID=4236 RepID=A0A9R1XUV9_LACSA|nr:hypothetical protein LSAT_V11C200069480 [Lactuca sativa]
MLTYVKTMGESMDPGKTLGESTTLGYKTMGVLLVLRFGGSFVASIERMKEVADLNLSFPEESHGIVLSAMGKTTNKLIVPREKPAICVSIVSEIDELAFLKELHYNHFMCFLASFLFQSFAT